MWAFGILFVIYINSNLFVSFDFINDFGIHTKISAISKITIPYNLHYNQLTLNK